MTNLNDILHKKMNDYYTRLEQADYDNHPFFQNLEKTLIEKAEQGAYKHVMTKSPPEYYFDLNDRRNRYIVSLWCGRKGLGHRIESLSPSGWSITISWGEAKGN